MILRHKGTDPQVEGVFDDSPVGVSPRGAVLVAGGVAIDVEFERAAAIIEQVVVKVGTLEKAFARESGVGGGANDNFFQNVNDFVLLLHEEHAHGVDIEIDGPDERQIWEN